MNPFSIACVGDSITEGWGLASPDTESYPALLRAYFPEATIYNLGSSGATLQSQFDMAYTRTNAFLRSLASSFDVVLLFLGANDVWYWTSKKTFKEELLDLIGEYASSLVILITPIKMNVGVYEDHKLKEIREIVLEAGKEEGLPIIDLYSISQTSWLSFDGVHPSQEGQKEIVFQIAQALKKILPLG